MGVEVWHTCRKGGSKLLSSQTSRDRGAGESSPASHAKGTRLTPHFLIYSHSERNMETSVMAQETFYQRFTETLAPQEKECKVLKRQRSSSPELLRCKRRLTFNGLGYSIPPQQPMAVARRNERERNRVKQVNMGFQTLRQHVPNGAANKKMSKVETLRSAVEYIRALQQLLDEHDAVSAVLQCGVPSPSGSNAYSAGPESPHSAYSSDEGSYEHLSSEEQELLDFTSWFDRYESGASLTVKDWC